MTAKLKAGPPLYYDDRPFPSIAFKTRPGPAGYVLLSVLQIEADLSEARFPSSSLAVISISCGRKDGGIIPLVLQIICRRRHFPRQQDCRSRVTIADESDDATAAGE